ncbi:MAG: MoaD/ThiS family protein [Acidobacteriota bacterium]|jgi:molybdopterin converting factor small subunit|nr:MoaD/ThiS family protein [Acidobacteriota bacterium]
MIEIEFNLRLAEQRDRLQTLDIGESIDLPQLADRLGLKNGDVGMLLVNGAWAQLDSVIKDGDRVQLYPYMEGG